MAGKVVYTKGEAVKVYSNSKGIWLDGVAEEVVLADCIMEGYSIPAGAVKVTSEAGTKWIMPPQVPNMIKKAPSTAGGGYAAASPPLRADSSRSVATESFGGSDMCRYKCGKRVQPGLTRGMKKYDTCCKNCSIRGAKGMEGEHTDHDQNCMGARNRRPTRSGLGALMAVKVKGTMEGWIKNSSPSLAKDLEAISIKPGDRSLHDDDMPKVIWKLCEKFGERFDVAGLLVKRQPSNVQSEQNVDIIRELLQFLYDRWFTEVLNMSTEAFVIQNPRPLEHVYTMGKKMGEGSFGIVFEATHKISEEVRVCKKIMKTAGGDMPDEDILQEIQNMAMLDHPNVIKVYEYFNDAKCISQIIEPCRGGELQDRIDDVYRKGGAPYDEAFMVDVMKQTLRALSFMHSKRFAHKDLKPQNIMLTDKGGTSIKVIDFGLAELFSEKQKTANFIGGTLLYMSPQCFIDKKMYLKCDIWSCGVILYNLMCGGMPFCAQWPPPPGKDQTWWEGETTKIISHQPMKVHPKLMQFSADCRDLLEKTLQKDMNRRPDAAECLSHKWFTVDDGEAPTLSIGVVQCLDVYAQQSELKKAIFLLMAHQSAAPNLQELRAIFTHFDKLNRGTLAADDLRGILADCGMKPVAADGVIHALDRDGDGEIGWTEFTAASLCVSVCRDEKLVNAAFAHFDSKSEDKINAKDFERVLSSHTAKKHPELAKRWLERLPQLVGEIMKLPKGQDAPPGFEITKLQFREYVGQDLRGFMKNGAALFAVG